MNDKEADIRRILFVCTGNTCRSPMAQAWLEQELARRNKAGKFLVESCGIYAADGMRASEGAVVRLRQDGIDLTPHRSRTVTRAMIELASLIFCMSYSHERYIKDLVPDAAGRIEVLDIGDPVGLGSQVYDECFREIVEALKTHLGRILEA